MKITHYATATDDRPPQVVSAVDFTDNWPFDEPSLDVYPCTWIKADGTSYHPQDETSQLDDDDTPILVHLEDSQYAVTSPEGLAAYLTRTGQTPIPPHKRLGSRAWVEANATPEPPTEPLKPSPLAQAFAVAHTAPKFDPEAAARRTDLMPTSPADIQIRLNEDQRQRLAEEVTAEPHAVCTRCTTELKGHETYRPVRGPGEDLPHCLDCFEEVTQ